MAGLTDGVGPLDLKELPMYRSATKNRRRPERLGEPAHSSALPTSAAFLTNTVPTKVEERATDDEMVFEK